MNDDLFWELRDKTRGTNGEAWDVVLVKIHRDTAQLVMDFVPARSADMWRINRRTWRIFREALRPRPEDFQPIDETEDIVERFQALLGAKTRSSRSIQANRRSEIPRTGAVHWNEDCNLVIGDRMNTKQTAAAWPEVSGDRHAVWAGRPSTGRPGCWFGRTVPIRRPG